MTEQELERCYRMLRGCLRTLRAEPDPKKLGLHAMPDDLLGEPCIGVDWSRAARGALSHEEIESAIMQAFRMGLRYHSESDKTKGTP